MRYYFCYNCRVVHNDKKKMVVNDDRFCVKCWVENKMVRFITKLRISGINESALKLLSLYKSSPGVIVCRFVIDGTEKTKALFADAFRIDPDSKEGKRALVDMCKGE